MCEDVRVRQSKCLTEGRDKRVHTAVEIFRERGREDFLIPVLKEREERET